MSEITRNLQQENQTALLLAVANIGQSDVGLAMGHDKTYVSRFLGDGQKISLNELLRMLDACGLRLSTVADNEVTISRDEYKALLLFSQNYANKALAAYRGAS